MRFHHDVMPRATKSSQLKQFMRMTNARHRRDSEGDIVMFRRVLFVTTVLVTFGVSVQAADSFNWTGFYAGVNSGYGIGNFHMPASGSLSTGGTNYAFDGVVNSGPSGIVGGAQVGYDRLFANNWLVGVEADAAGTSIGSRLNADLDLGGPGTLQATIKSNLQYVGTVRGRFGYVTDSNYLFYATGGFAYGGVRTDFGLNLSRGGATLLDVTAWDRRIDYGWTAGAGVERPITDHLSLRTEYLYFDLGSHTIADGTFSVPSGTGYGTIRIGTIGHLIRIGLNYALN